MSDSDRLRSPLATLGYKPLKNQERGNERSRRRETSDLLVRLAGSERDADVLLANRRSPPDRRFICFAARDGLLRSIRCRNPANLSKEGFPLRRAIYRNLTPGAYGYSDQNRFDQRFAFVRKRYCNCIVEISGSCSQSNGLPIPATDWPLSCT